MSLKFEWSRAKARSNYAKHGVTFAFATQVFTDPFAVEFLDDRKDYGEERFVIIGMADEHLVYVAYTERLDAIRLISARRATKYEQEIYYEANS
jgi:uncharacterized DUF497 family protein